MKEGRFVLPALAGALGLATIAAAAEPTTAELREQIEALQKKVSQIEAREQSAAQQQATMQSVLDDAQRRSQLLQTGAVTAGWDGKAFYIGSADGDFTIKPIFQFQIRNVTNFRDGTTTDDDDWQNGFEVRRMKFGMQGNVFGKELSYKFLWATNRGTGSPTLEEAWARYKFADDWSVRAGQFKDPLNRESLTSSSQFLATERSYQADIFYGGDNFVQGVSVIYENANKPLKAEIAFTDGANSFNNNFQDPPTGLDQNFGFAGRVDYLVFGDWKAVNDFSGAKVEKDSLVLGVAADYSEGEQADAGTQRVVRYTADALFKTASHWALYAALNGRSTDINGGASNNDYGFVAQAAYAIDNRWEPFVRYGFTSFDAVPAGMDDTVHEITGGVNYYYYGHNAKFTIDMTYLPNGAPFGDGGADILTGDDDQFILRGQFQLSL